ncbi:hypothetical protein ABZV31_27820 [Streptomyces sp. NPDC005202]|uniref:hypothetical protein n=1 Tax=Streptomyces sp. NPDC005202 TaxID=3157021 RepID=UPI0033A47BE7
MHRKDWQQYATDPAAPVPVEQVEQALEPVDAKKAAALMGSLASTCLVWPGATFMEPAKADDVARRVVNLVGPGAQWWSNRDGDSGTGVSACTFDSLVAGTDGHRFAVLIQVGDS